MMQKDTVQLLEFIHDHSWVGLETIKLQFKDMKNIYPTLYNYVTLGVLQKIKQVGQWHYKMNLASGDSQRIIKEYFQGNSALKPIRASALQTMNLKNDKEPIMVADFSFLKTKAFINHVALLKAIYDKKDWTSSRELKNVVHSENIKHLLNIYQEHEIVTIKKERCKSGTMLFYKWNEKSRKAIAVMNKFFPTTSAIHIKSPDLLQNALPKVTAVIQQQPPSSTITPAPIGLDGMMTMIQTQLTKQENEIKLLKRINEEQALTIKNHKTQNVLIPQKDLNAIMKAAELMNERHNMEMKHEIRNLITMINNVMSVQTVTTKELVATNNSILEVRNRELDILTLMKKFADSLGIK